MQHKEYSRVESPSGSPPGSGILGWCSAWHPRCPSHSRTRCQRSCCCRRPPRRLEPEGRCHHYRESAEHAVASDKLCLPGIVHKLCMSGTVHNDALPMVSSTTPPTMLMGHAKVLVSYWEGALNWISMWQTMLLWAVVLLARRAASAQYAACSTPSRLGMAQANNP